MYVKCALAIFLAVTIERTNSVIAEKGKFEFIKPSPIDELPDERRLTNFKERPEKIDDKLENGEKSDSEKTKDSRQEKQTRTILSTPGTKDVADNPHCCGSRYEFGSPNRPEAGQISGTSSETGRYPSRYGSRPEDRYGWQSFNPGSSGRRGSIVPSPGTRPGELYGSNSGGDRYGTRPSYYGEGNDYDRPSNSGNRPGRPSYGYGGNVYGDNGAYGSHGYEVSRPGSGYGSRPPGVTSFGSGRPGSGSYGGGSYGGGHGIYGTIGEQESEFPAQDDGPEGANPHHPGINNLQTQKAVALKALAGVALIGAAAALATNPVLLPIGVLAGRRRRSVSLSSQIEDADVYEVMKLLENHVPKFYKENIRREMVDSPSCMARLVCEIQKEYNAEKTNNNKNNNKDQGHENRINVSKTLKKHLVNLIRSKVVETHTRYKNIEQLIKSAEAYNERCNVFICDIAKD